METQRDALKMCEVNSSTVDRHPIFVKDPAELIKYVCKEVEVESSDGSIHRGWVYTIDPVSDSIVLLQFPSDPKLSKLSIDYIDIIFGHSVSAITILNEDGNQYAAFMESLFKPADSYSPNDLASRKSALKAWLLKNRLPVEEKGSGGSVLSIKNVIQILPPYTEHDCQGKSEIILGRVQGLIKNMPDDI